MGGQRNRGSFAIRIRDTGRGEESTPEARTVATCPRTSAVVKPLIPPPTITESSTLPSSTGATVGDAVELELAESRIPRNVSLLGPRTNDRLRTLGALTVWLLHATVRWGESASIVLFFFCLPAGSSAELLVVDDVLGPEDPALVGFGPEHPRVAGVERRSGRMPRRAGRGRTRRPSGARFRPVN